MATNTLIVVVLCCVAFASATSHVPEPDVSILCTESSFTPNVYLNWTTWPNVTIELKVGDSTAAECDQSFNASSNGNITAIPYNNANGNAACNGTLTNTTSIITYAADLILVITQKTRGIEREWNNSYELKCQTNRTVNASSGTVGYNYTVTLQTKSPVNNTFDVAFLLEFYANNEYSVPENAIFTVDSTDDVYFKISEGSDDFYFEVLKCWATMSVAAIGPTPDVFWKDGCPVDPTISFNYTGQNFYAQILPFFFVGHQSSTVYFHCELLIWLYSSTDNRKNETICDAGKRRRRSVETEQGEDEEGTERRIITSPQHIVFENSGVFAPTCGEGYVYDRVDKECTNTRVMEVRGVYFKAEQWNSQYADTSSDKFTALSREKSYLLFALFQTTGRDFIRGVKVIRAREGSVIVDVLVTYDETVDEETAFKGIEAALQTTTDRQTRVMNVLQIEQSKTIEYVPIMTNHVPPVVDSDKIILIVVIVVLLVLICFAGIVVFKRRQMATQVAPTKAAFDNNM